MTHQLTYEVLSLRHVDWPTLEKLFGAGQVDEDTAERHSQHMQRFNERIRKAMPPGNDTITVGECFTDTDLDKFWRETI